MKDMIRRKPLQGIRILDTSHIFAIPYATGLLSDLGAEVIKIHATNRADSMAGGGPFPENNPGPQAVDQAGCLNTINRGKQGLMLDLTKPKGAAIFKELVAKSDIVTEGYTPRVMKKFGLDYQSLTAIKPDIIMLSNTGYGHTGPWNSYGGVATSLEGISGMCWLTGYVDRGPRKVGQSHTDFLACWNAAYAILAALYRRQKTGRGQWIDLSMYQAGAAAIGPAIMDYVANGRIGTRMGNRDARMAPHGVFPTQGDDRWIAIAVDTDQAWQKLRTLMSAPAWMAEPRYETADGRLADQDEIERNLAAWTAPQDGWKLAESLQASGILASVVEDARDLIADPHLKHRQYFEKVRHPEASGIGERLYIGRAWKMSSSDLAIQGPTPMLGEHNRQILTKLLAYTDAEVDRLIEEDVVCETLKAPPRLPPIAVEELRQRGRIGQYDPNYLRAQGIEP